MTQFKLSFPESIFSAHQRSSLLGLPSIKIAVFLAQHSPERDRLHIQNNHPFILEEHTQLFFRQLILKEVYYQNILIFIKSELPNGLGNFPHNEFLILKMQPWPEPHHKRQKIYFFNNINTSIKYLVTVFYVHISGEPVSKRECIILELSYLLLYFADISWGYNIRLNNIQTNRQIDKILLTLDKIDGTIKQGQKLSIRT